ncbi:DUF402 domain-containing protein [Longispora albida]|uniref:DUF402 domain-containing protein n=1 Tax=Longispora albida TaxID=203523 RepID=UPI0003785E9B|nr:DUF402 domain-containing protein [Longispora albida]
MRFREGEVVVRRGLLPDGRINQVECGLVVSDDERGLLVSVPDGSEAVRLGPDGLTVVTWHAPKSLMLVPPGAACAVWWRWDEAGEFLGWYVNLETPAVRWHDQGYGIDGMDQALDVLIAPGGSWEWKDEAEFESLTGRPLYWDDRSAAAIRAEGERMVALAASGAFPFDGTWQDFEPDPAWGPLRMPPWWDLPSPGVDGVQIGR